MQYQPTLTQHASQENHDNVMQGKTKAADTTKYDKNSNNEYATQCVFVNNDAQSPFDSKGTIVTPKKKVHLI